MAYVSPFGNSPAPSGGSKPKGTGYISPFEGSIYTEDYWKKRQEEDQARQQDDLKKKQVQENLDKTDEAVKKSQEDIWKPSNILGDVAKAAGNFTAAVNEKVLGGAAKAAVKAYNTVTTGFNQDEANKRTDDFLKSTKQVNDQGAAPLASGAGINRDSMSFKVGEGAGDVAKTLTVDVPGDIYKSARNMVNQARISSEIGGGPGLDQPNADKLIKFVDEDEKAGKLTKEQADEKRNKIQSEVAKTQEAIKRGEEKTGVKYDQNSGAISTLETAANAAGLVGVGKKIFEKTVEVASQRLDRDLNVGELKNLAVRARDAIDKNVRSDAMQGFSPKANDTESIMPNVNEGQFKGTFLDPQKVEVGGASGSTDIGVSTPVKPGVKDISVENSVEVRRPDVMTEDDYNKQFNKLNNAYDKELKSLESMPPLKQKAASNAIEEKYTKALADLDENFNNPKLPDGTSKVKQIGKSTTTTPTTGGTPKGFVNTTGEMNDIEKTLFTAAKDRAEKRLGRPLSQQETSGIYDKTRKLAEEKGFSAPTGRTGNTPATKTLGNEAEVLQTKEASPNDGVKTTSDSVDTEKASSYEQSPDGTDKVSGNSARIEQVALEKKLTEKMGDLPQYKSINMKEQADEAVKLINTDKQKAVDIIEGKANPEGNLKAQSIHQALEDLAVREGDGELLTKLAKSHVNTELSEGAQKLRIAAERDPHSPVEAIRQVREARQKAVEARSKTTVAKEKQAIKSKVNAATPKVKKETWDSFVKGLEC